MDEEEADYLFTPPDPQVVDWRRFIPNGALLSIQADAWEEGFRAASRNSLVNPYSTQ